MKFMFAVYGNQPLRKCVCESCGCMRVQGKDFDLFRHLESTEAYSQEGDSQKIA